MEHNRKHKLLMIIALVFGIASLSVGFAAFSTTLSISSSASVTPNSDTFSIKFSTNKDSLVTGNVAPSDKTSGLITTDGVIDNATNPTIKNLSAIFTSPGQHVVYTFYARNEGEYTAYLNNVNFLGNKTCIADAGTTDSLVQSACESINIYVIVDNESFSETAPVTGHVLEKKTGEIVRVLIQYVGSGTSADGPFTVKFPNVALVYSTLDDSSIQPTLPKAVKLVSGDLNTPGGIVSIGNEQFYVIGQEDGNVKLLAMYNLHVGSSVVNSYIATPLENPTGIQDKDAKAFNWDSVNQVVISPFIGSTAFSNVNSSYEGSIVEGYVNDYATYLEELGANIEEARLITKSEIISLGCIGEYVSCSESPEWLFSTSYWSGSNYDSSNVYGMEIRGQVIVQSCSYPYDLGVRPVIEISLSEF